MTKNIQNIDIPGIFKAPLQYSHVTIIPETQGYLLELSGMIGFNEQGKLVSDNARDQAIRTLHNIARVIIGTAKEYQIDHITESDALNCVVTTISHVVQLRENAKENFE